MLFSWTVVCVSVAVGRGATYIEDFRQCRPASNIKEFGVVAALPLASMRNCLSMPVEEILQVNVQVGHIGHLILKEYGDEKPPVEILLLVQRHGGIWYLGIHGEGNHARWDLESKPKGEFGSHSCLNRDQFCGLVAAVPTPEGFLAIDRNRLQRFDYNWAPSDDQLEKTDVPAAVASFGEFNTAADEFPDTQRLMAPTNVVEYRPFNLTFISEEFEISPLFPTSFGLSQRGVRPRFAFVTDTGNHRLVMLDATDVSQFTYMMQFGVTGTELSGNEGFNWPVGIAIGAPGNESNHMSVAANIFVADQRNDRLVKIDLVDTVEGFRLAYSCDYGSAPDEKGFNIGLNQPAGVSLYRHYIFVAEVMGNAITVLQVDHRNTSAILFVTLMLPTPGVKLTGSLSVSHKGYVWYTYIDTPQMFSIGTMFVSRELRESRRPSLLDDYVALCVNETWYNKDLLMDATVFSPFMQKVLDIAKVNSRFPDWHYARETADSETAYLPIDAFNLSRRGKFDFARLNRTIFRGTLKFCGAPPVPTAPPMMSGDEDGWNSGGTDVAAVGGAPRRCGSSWPLSSIWATLIALAVTLAEKD